MKTDVLAERPDVEVGFLVLIESFSAVFCKGMMVIRVSRTVAGPHEVANVV